MSAWKPGDVASLRLAEDADGRSDKSERAIAIRDNVGSWACGAAFGRHVKDSHVLDARRLLVIDPEDREQVAVVVIAAEAQGLSHRDEGVDYMQAALRSLLAPPKPDEPTGLGAVVEDSSGDRWIHVGNGCWSVSILTSGYAADEAPFSWQGIAAVRVLSEGVAE